jgi:type IV secretion system protein VirB6
MSACPAFSSDGSAGIASALRSVDCMTAHTTGYAFSRLFSTNGLLLPALTTLLTLYVAFFAVGLLTGRTRLGIGSLTPRMLTLGLVLTLSTSWVAYQGVVWNLAVGAPDQVAGVLVGTHGSATTMFADRLDELFAKVADAASQAPTSTDQAHKAAGFSPADLLWISALMLLLGTVGVLVTARIALAALLALGPIFIVFALFQGTRGLFEGWLKATVLFSCVPLFTVLIGGGSIAMLAPFADTLGGGEVTLHVAVSMFVGAAVYCALTFMALKVATTLVSGWRIPFSGAVVAAEAHAHQTPIGTPTARMIAPTPTASRDRRPPNANERVREMISGMMSLPAPSAMHASSSRSLKVTMHPSVPQAIRPAFDPRISSIGDRYRRDALRTAREPVR